MKRSLLLATAMLTLASSAFAQSPAPAGGEYKLLSATKVGGQGGFDYVYADSEGRKLYIPRGNRVTVFDLDANLKSLGEIPDTRGVHGVAVDPASHHGFASSNPVVMFDTTSLKTIKSIDVKGRPDGILFEPFTKHIFILSHSQPNVTVINAEDGAVVGTIDLGGAPEQAASDGKGRVYIDLEDKDQIAVVDPVAMKTLAHYDLAGKGGGPAGLGFDAANNILFAFCHEPATCVILSATDGKILNTLPIGAGVDGGTFNPATNEAFSSQGDGTLTIIKENSPTDFAVEQTVQTKRGAKTCTLDTKTNHILLITADYAAPSTQPANAGNGNRPRGGRNRGQMVPDSFQILTVGK